MKEFGRNFCGYALAGWAAFFAAFLATTTVAHAEYPERPIRAIVPFDPGGANDTMARLLSGPISKALNVPVVVENKPGTSGNIGIEHVAKSAPDGYTILFSASSSTINPAMFASLPYDPIKDIAAVVLIGEGPYGIFANPKLPVNNLQELIAHAKANPGKLNAASGGLAGTRLALELLKLQNGIDFQIIPYQGTGAASVALMSGETDIAIMDTSALIGHLASGRVKGLAIASETRLSSQPNLPTTREAGIPNYTAGTIFGIYAAGPTPPAIVEKLNGTVNAILADPEIAKKLNGLGVEVARKTPQEFTRIYRGQIEQWKEVVSKAKIERQ